MTTPETTPPWAPQIHMKRFGGKGAMLCLFWGNTFRPTQASDEYLCLAGFVVVLIGFRGACHVRSKVGQQIQVVQIGEVATSSHEDKFQPRPG